MMYVPFMAFLICVRNYDSYLWTISHLILMTALPGKYYYCQVTNEEIEMELR